jgi:hypothetical protein
MGVCSCTLPISCCKNCINNQTFPDINPVEYQIIEYRNFDTLEKIKKRERIREIQKIVDKWK